MLGISVFELKKKMFSCPRREAEREEQGRTLETKLNVYVRFVTVS